MDTYADPAEPACRTTCRWCPVLALVVVDPQVDFLDQNGVAWGVVGESVQEQGVVDNLERLFIAAKAVTCRWSSRRTTTTRRITSGSSKELERVMHGIGLFDRKSTDLEGFEVRRRVDAAIQEVHRGRRDHHLLASQGLRSGAERSVLQLRKLIDKVILAGMSANLCARATCANCWRQASRSPSCVTRHRCEGSEGDGYLAALINFRMITNAVWWTDEAVERIAQTA